MFADSLTKLADDVNGKPVRVKFPKGLSIGPVQILADEFFKSTERQICEEEKVCLAINLQVCTEIS